MFIIKDLNLTNFNKKNVKCMNYMFSGCSEELKKKIKNQYKGINENAFLILIIYFN